MLCGLKTVIIGAHSVGEEAGCLMPLPLDFSEFSVRPKNLMAPKWYAVIGGVEVCRAATPCKGQFNAC